MLILFENIQKDNNFFFKEHFGSMLQNGLPNMKYKFEVKLFNSS